MRILGIDPGIGRVGWGVITKEKASVRAIAYDCFETKKDMTLPRRLQLIYEEMSRLIGVYTPDVIAVEDLFFNKNVKTAFAVGQARGVILLAAAQKSTVLHFYTPLSIKSAVTGYGKADKKQVGQMVKITLGLTKIPTPDDTADALAIAITHAYTTKPR